MSEVSDQTPLMKQYLELKAQAGDALLFFRMGDFYELFGEDALVASQILEITLTSRDKNKPNPVPMAGVPHHAAAGYIQKLLNSGKRVAIGEQMEDLPPVVVAKGKQIVRREIVRIFTPGVQFDLEGAEAAFLAVALPGENAANQWILALLDVSTGQTLLSDWLSEDELSSELTRASIKHLLRIANHLPKKTLLQIQGERPELLVEDLASNVLTQQAALEILKRQYGLAVPEALITIPEALRAIGILIQYVCRSQKQDRLAHLHLPLPLHSPNHLVLGPRSQEHLGLDELFELIRKTRSSPGARALKQWLLEPLLETQAIASRQQMVRELSQNPFALKKLSESLSQIYDCERILGRVSTQLANPRDTLALGKTLDQLLPISGQLASFVSEEFTARKNQFQSWASSLTELTKRIVTQQCDNAPLVARDGGIFNRGTHPELDRLLTLTQDGERYLVELEAREREATGISSLKIRYNRVFGYYIEITQTHLKSVPAHYQRKQTMVGAERFFTEELKKFEEEILTASSKQKTLEIQLFEELLLAIREHTPRILEAARGLAELDALQSLAQLTFQSGWTFPQIDESPDLEVAHGRHPVVDARQAGFVPNSLTLSPETRLTLLVTGPNMGGKSTIMRQIALMVILGKMGAPVPASSARWGAVSSVYTRIGAQDAISRGQSTFMVEMSELAHILQHANSRSLLVLDEIGRGTSTYDGMSVAWATLEWITKKIKARTLFATHYHELTHLEGQLPSLGNAHLAVEANRKGDQKLRFLYELKDGPTADSFGIHVARLAGLPSAVVERAWEVLADLEAQSPAGSGSAVSSNQLSFFDLAAPAPIHTVAVEPEPALPSPGLRTLLEEIEQLQVNEMTPLQALNWVSELKGKIESA